jgi:hypothetical protein
VESRPTSAARTSGHSKIFDEVGVASIGGLLSHSGSAIEMILLSRIAFSGIWYLKTKEQKCIR